jgi:hypothetical protein
MSPAPPASLASTCLPDKTLGATGAARFGVPLFPLGLSFLRAGGRTFAWEKVCDKLQQTQMTKTREHFFAVMRHWVALMSGIASLALGLLERFRHIVGIPNWVFLIVSTLCFFAAFHLAWLDKDNELQAALGPAPEVVLEWQCGKGNPLILRNMRGSTAYHLQIKEVLIADRCSATFEEVSHLAEGTHTGALPLVTDKFNRPDTDQGRALRNDFMHVLEVAYQTWGRDFDPVQLQLLVTYEDRNGKRYATHCNIVFDRFQETAKVTCEPPHPVKQ